MPLTFGPRPTRYSLHPWRADTSEKLQHRTRTLEARTRHQRVHSPDIVPGLLQTPDYATAVLTTCLHAAGRPAIEVGAALAQRVKRQQDWQQHPRRISFVLGEQALYTQVGSVAVMEFQLLCLLGNLELPPTDTTIAILPRTAPFTPTTNFVLYDDQVDIETLTNAITLTRAHDLSDYEHTFAQLTRHAYTGQDAAQLITDAITFHTRRPEIR
ncbi:Scr1 family TA system antitoxin-like transcriptional regulator [Nocardia takedensis]|uniref:Scr1 family TA system antitoxin-like transcriptional regulator n=1 Tax=Nocardia takedensis TaxID=259390 RepID=UPI003F76A819